MPSAEISQVPPTEEVPVANVQVGDVSLTDDGLYEVTNDGIWEDYYIINQYEKDHHRYMMGITSPNPFQGDQVAFVQLAATTLLLVSDWTAERRGSQPTIPEPEPADDNMVLLDDDYDLAMLLVGADGENPIWRISGTYVYGFKNPNGVPLIYPRPPWMSDLGTEREVDDDAFQEGLIDTGTSSGSSSSSLGS